MGHGTPEWERDLLYPNIPNQLESCWDTGGTQWLVRQTPKFEQVTGHVTFATFEPYMVTRTQCTTGVPALPERSGRWEASGLADYHPVQ